MKWAIPERKHSLWKQNVHSGHWIYFHPLPMFCSSSELLNMVAKVWTSQLPYSDVLDAICFCLGAVSSWDLENARETMTLRGQMGSSSCGCRWQLGPMFSTCLVGVGGCDFGRSVAEAAAAADLWSLEWCKSFDAKSHVVASWLLLLQCVKDFCKQFIFILNPFLPEVPSIVSVSCTEP